MCFLIAEPADPPATHTLCSRSHVLRSITYTPVDNRSIPATQPGGNPPHPQVRPNLPKNRGEKGCAYKVGTRAHFETLI